MKLAMSVLLLLALEWLIRALNSFGFHDWFRDRFMSKACELQSVTEIVTGKENTLSQADMTKFWETLFQT